MSIQLPQLRRAQRQPLGALLVIVGLAIASIHSSAAASDPSVGIVSTGWYHTCSIRSDGALACWGDNSYGQASPPAGAFIAISTGDHHSCGIRSDGTLACWGLDNYGQASPPGGTFSAVSAGSLYTCGAHSDGTLACWGQNGFGRAFPPGGAFNALDSGTYHSCGVRADGTLECWGTSAFGANTPPSGTFVAVGAGTYFACGVRGDNTLACWGDNAYGRSTPPTGAFTAIDAGDTHSCGVRSDGTLACWGNNANGQGVAPAGAFNAVSAGMFHSCGVRANGTLACWGYNGQGQAPQPELLPATLPDSTVNAAYSQAFGLLDTTSATASYPYTPPTPGFALTSGAAPPGMNLTASGTLSGTPTAAGSFSFTVEGEDANGFVAQRSYVLNVQPPPDSSAPLITPTVAGTFGDNGWYRGDVTISWEVTDAESAVTASTGCSTSTLTTDALGAGYTCTATSTGGTTSGSVTIKRDATAPVLAPAVTPSVILLHGNGTATANATDALSGVATQSCAALVTSAVGSHASACTATDTAGNTATAAAAYEVIHGFVGFTTPVDNAPTVNVANAGQAVPFKWKLIDASGAPMTNLASVTISVLAISCSSGAVADAVEQYVASASALQNLGGGYYQYNWKSPKTYQGTCKQLVLDLGDGSTRIALFRFK